MGRMAVTVEDESGSGRVAGTLTLDGVDKRRRSRDGAAAAC
jgi:hypothetical protein